MNLNPTVRTILTALVAALAVVAVALPTLGAPLWVGIIIGAVVAACAAIGIVPPQVGGTQQGLVNPSLTSPPAIDTPQGEAVVVENPAQAGFDQDAVVPTKRGYEGRF
jgi:hypothetical protein